MSEQQSADQCCATCADWAPLELEPKQGYCLSPDADATDTHALSGTYCQAWRAKDGEQP